MTWDAIVKILFAADIAPNPDAGAAGTELQTIEALRRLGHEVDAVWAVDLPHRIRHGNLHALFELPRRYRDLLRQRPGYDVYHLNQPHAYMAARAHRASGAPGIVVNRSHGWDARGPAALRPWHKVFGGVERRFPRNLSARFFEAVMARQSRFVARDAAGIIVSCSECREYILRVYGLWPERVACIAQAAPDLYHERPVRDMTAARLRRMLCIGQFAFFKGPHVLAAAMNELAAADVDVTLTWVCAGEHHAAAAALLSPAARARTRFEPWRPQRELMALIDEHGVFLAPALTEGFCKTFLEAMTRGLCVVGARSAGMRDLIEDGGNGLLVPVGDGAGMARAVQRLLAGPDAAVAMAGAARRCGGEHTWDRVGRETAAFYERLLAR